MPFKMTQHMIYNNSWISCFFHFISAATCMQNIVFRLRVLNLLGWHPLEDFSNTSRPYNQCTHQKKSHWWDWLTCRAAPYGKEIERKKKWYLFLLHQFYKVLQVPGAVQPHGFDGALGLELYHTVLETTSSVLSEQHSDKLWWHSGTGTSSHSP